MMPRDSGKVYMGEVKGNGFGSGTITVVMDGVTYSGPGVRVTSNETFGFGQAYGFGSKNTLAVTGTSFSDGGTTMVKAILSSPTGKGLRCDLSTTGSGGGGICVDDQQRVYDAIITR